MKIHTGADIYSYSTNRPLSGVLTGVGRPIVRLFGGAGYGIAANNSNNIIPVMGQMIYYGVVVIELLKSAHIDSYEGFYTLV